MCLSFDFDMKSIFKGLGIPEEAMSQTQTQADEDVISPGDYVELGPLGGDDGPRWSQASSRGTIGLPIVAVVRVEAKLVGGLVPVFHPDADLKANNIVYVSRKRCKKVLGPVTKTHKCHCDNAVLFSEGCRCGGV